MIESGYVARSGAGRRESWGQRIMVTLDIRIARHLAALAPVAALVLGGFVVPAGRGDVLAHAGHGMPTRLQQGTCADVGPVAFELIGVGATEDSDGNEIPEPENVGASKSGAVLASVTTVPAALDTIVASEHTLVVYESDDAMDVTVACGDIGGIVVGEELVVGLAAEGEAGMSGIALFRAEEEQTVVSVFLVAADDGHEGDDAHGDDDGATPEA